MPMAKKREIRKFIGWGGSNVKNFAIMAGKIILTCVSLYLMGAFINASFNIALWEAGWRVIIGIIGLFFSGFIIFLECIK